MCSYIELYNEDIRDLLGSSCGGVKSKLELRESPDKGVFIKDLIKMPVTTEEEMARYIQIGNSKRCTGKSRCLFRINFNEFVIFKVALYLHHLRLVSGAQGRNIEFCGFKVQFS